MTETTVAPPETQEIEAQEGKEEFPFPEQTGFVPVEASEIVNYFNQMNWGEGEIGGKKLNDLIDELNRVSQEKKINANELLLWMLQTEQTRSLSDRLKDLANFVRTEKERALAEKGKSQGQVIEEEPEKSFSERYKDYAASATKPVGKVEKPEVNELEEDGKIKYDTAPLEMPHKKPPADSTSVAGLRRAFQGGEAEQKPLTRRLEVTEKAKQPA